MNKVDKRKTTVNNLKEMLEEIRNSIKNFQDMEGDLSEFNRGILFTQIKTETAINKILWKER
jgi:hypothetical protein